MSDINVSWRSHIENHDSLQAWDGKAWYAATVWGVDQNQDGKEDLMICFDNCSCKSDFWCSRQSKRLRPTIGFLRKKIMIPQSEHIKALLAKVERLESDKKELLNPQSVVSHPQDLDGIEKHNQMENMSLRAEIERLRTERDELARKLHHKEGVLDKLAKQNEIYQQKLTEMTHNDTNAAKGITNSRHAMPAQLEAGGFAKLHGLSKTEYNGKIVSVLEYVAKKDRWRVQLLDHPQPNAKALGAKTENLVAVHLDTTATAKRTNDAYMHSNAMHINKAASTRKLGDEDDSKPTEKQHPLSVGELAKLRRLSHDDEFNGLIVEVVRYVKKKDRWRVKLMDTAHKEKFLAVRRENLEAMNMNMSAQSLQSRRRGCDTRGDRKESKGFKQEADNNNKMAKQKNGGNMSASWKSRMSSIENSHCETDQEEKQQTESKNEVKRLQQELEDKTKEFRKRISEEKNECNKLKKEMKEMKERSDKLESERSGLDAEIERLQKTVSEEQQKLKKETEKVQQIQQDLEVLINRVEETNTQNTTLTEQLEAHKTDLKERNDTIQKHEDKISELERSLNEKHTEIVKVKQEHETLNEELAKKHQQLQDTQKAHKDLEKEKTARVQEMQTVVDDHKQMLSQREDELKAMADVYKQKEEVLADYMQQCEELKQDQQKFEQQLKATHQTNESKDLQIQQMHQENERLQSKHKVDIAKFEMKLTVKPEQLEKQQREHQKAEAMAKKKAASITANVHNPYFDSNLMAGLHDFGVDQNADFLKKFGVQKTNKADDYHQVPHEPYQRHNDELGCRKTPSNVQDYDRAPNLPCQSEDIDDDEEAEPEDIIAM